MSIVTPDILKQAKGDTFEHFYLATQVIGHGCGGPDGEDGNYNLAFKKENSLAEFETMVEVVNKEVKAIINKAEEEALSLAGSAPLWNEEWTGSHEEWKIKNKEWNAKAFNKADERPIRKELWKALYDAKLLPAFEHTILNQEYLVDETNLSEHDLFVIGVYDDRGCHCPGGEYYFYDSDEASEAPLVFPFPIDASVTPKATIIYVEDGWKLITSGHLYESQIKSKLHGLAVLWEQNIQSDIAELFNLESQYSSLISTEELENLDYAQYQIHKDDPSQGFKVKRALHNLKEPGHSLTKSLKKMKLSTLMVK
jgi:hypothetical protein